MSHCSTRQVVDEYATRQTAQRRRRRYPPSGAATPGAVARTADRRLVACAPLATRNALHRRWGRKRHPALACTVGSGCIERLPQHHRFHGNIAVARLVGKTALACDNRSDRSGGLARSVPLGQAPSCRIAGVGIWRRRSHCGHPPMALASGAIAQPQDGWNHGTLGHRPARTTSGSAGSGRGSDSVARPAQVSC